MSRKDQIQSLYARQEELESRIPPICDQMDGDPDLGALDDQLRAVIRERLALEDDEQTDLDLCFFLYQ